MGEPVFFTLKRMLRSCANIKQALALITKAKPLGNGSIIISDATAKEAIVIELHNGLVGLRRSKTQMIGNANHYTKAAWKKLPAGLPANRADWPVCSEARKHGQAGQNLTSKDLQAIMSSKAVLQDINLLSVIFKPSENSMLLSCGSYRAASRVFSKYKLFEEKN
jgi:hypothetical protein